LPSSSVLCTDLRLYPYTPSFQLPSNHSNLIFLGTPLPLLLHVVKGVAFHFQCPGGHVTWVSPLACVIPSSWTTESQIQGFCSMSWGDEAGYLLCRPWDCGREDSSNTSLGTESPNTPGPAGSCRTSRCVCCRPLLLEAQDHNSCQVPSCWWLNPRVTECLEPLASKAWSNRPSEL
jgi:hypothetical protein